MAILTLSYVAQALVVVIVGLNLGFRYDMLSLHSTDLVTGTQLLSYDCAFLLQLQGREPKSVEEVILEEGKRRECVGCPLLEASKQQCD